MEIKAISPKDYGEAFELVGKVFDEFEAPEYSEEGVRSFKSSLKDEKYVSQLKVYTAVDKNKVIGVIATRNNSTHIALFFVDRAYQGKGIGRQLFELAAADNCMGFMTVNSSPYAVKIYRKLGFEPIDEEKTDGGIRYTPMVLKGGEKK